MRRRLEVAVVGLFAPAALFAGVGAWTTNAPAPAGHLVVDSVTGGVYAGASNGLVRSDDHGATWTPACSEGGPSAVPLAARAGTVYVLGTDRSLYASGDGGRHCVSVFESVVAPSVGNPGPSGPGSFETVGVVTDPFTTATLYRNNVTTASGNGVGIANIRISSVLTRSSDGGATWSPISGAFNGPVNLIAADPGTRGVLYAITTGQIPGLGTPTLYRSRDGGSSWSPLATFPEPSGLATLSVDPLSPSTIYADQWRSTDGGATFSKLSGDDKGLIVPDPRNRNRLYAVSSDQGVVRTDDGGATWNPMNAGLNPYETSIFSLAIEPNSVFLHAATAYAIYDFEIVAPGAMVLGDAETFTISLSAIDPRTGQAAAGVATQVNDLWGYFSIPAITGNANNPEVFVKLLNGTAINGEYWFFYGGLTTLEYTLTVTAVTTGAQKTYTKPAGSECGGSDTAAFTP
jgi:photosystem II stability/assembly factor-like uncharacterized protein